MSIDSLLAVVVVLQCRRGIDSWHLIRPSVVSQSNIAAHLLFFFLMIRPPPISPLFPYPPLFRFRFCTTPDRVQLAYAVSGEGPPLVMSATWLTHLSISGAVSLGGHGSMRSPLSTRFCGMTRVAVDRKSTRLNSSHLVISYAVFCL